MKAYKKWSLVGLIASASMAICAITFSHTSFASSAFKKGDASEYTLTLNSSNSYVSGSEQSIATDSGDYQVVFSYSSCVSASSAHALINDGGTIVNKDHIRSISKLQATYTGGKLKARTSYDRSTWGEYFELSSGFEYSFGSYPYYVELKAFDAVILTSAKFTYTCLENAAAHEGETPKGEELLGVINFWNVNNLNVTGDGTGTTLIDVDYVDAHSYTDTKFNVSADIVSAVTKSNTYQDRYGGIGMGSSKNNGSFTLSLNKNYHTDKVVVRTLALSTSTLNGEAVSTAFTKTEADLANSLSLTFAYESLQSSVSFTATYRLAIYQIYFYNTNGDSQIDYDTPKDEIGFTATDSKKDTYLENSVFDTANGLSVSANFSDGTSETIAKADYSYKILNSNDQEINTAQAFGTPGNYSLVISYKNFIPQIIDLEVGEYVYLTGVTASMSTTTFAADARLSDNLSNNLTAGKQFNYTKYNENNIAYASFATKHLEVKLLNPSDVEASITTAFTTPGSWKVRVRSTDDNTKYADVAITVTPVKATGVTLSSSTLDLIEGATHTLTATVTPSTATDKTVTWSSNKESVATVNNGVVTAVKEGSAIITATVNDGSGAKGTCTVTVSEKPATETATITISGNKTNNQEWAMAASDFTCNGISLTSVSSDKVFGTGEASARFASGSYGGSLTFNFAQKLIVGVKIYAAKYGSDKPTITVTTSANTTGQSKGLDDNTSLVFDAFATDTVKSTSLTISSPKDHRFYLTKVELTIGSDAPVYPTSISLSGNATVGVGKTTNLTVNYTPATTNQKNVTWSSNNSSVATVNNGAVKGISAGNATITAKALKKDSTYATATFDITVVEEALDPYTILIYMCGSDLESENGEATNDIKEILNSNVSSDINIAIETGGSTSWKKYGIPNDKLGRYHVSGTNLVNDDYLDDANMGADSTFQSFLEWGLSTYPAQQTGVILWNHGGAMSGCCSDSHSNDTLSPSELVSAVDSAFENLSIDKLDWIGYDCCLMSVADIASINSDYFNYMIASEESEWGAGWDYDAWLPVLDENPSIQPSELLPVICDTFVSYYDTAYSGYGPEDNNQTLAALDLTKMSAFVAAFENYTTSLNINSFNKWTTLRTAFDKSLQFGYDSTYKYTFGIADFNSFLSNMESSFSASQTALKAALDNLVIHNAYGGWYDSATGYPCGLCVFVPVTSGGDGQEGGYYWGPKSNYPETSTKFTKWREMHINYSDFWDQ